MKNRGFLFLVTEYNSALSGLSGFSEGGENKQLLIAIVGISYFFPLEKYRLNSISISLSIS